MPFKRAKAGDGYTYCADCRAGLRRRYSGLDRGPVFKPRPCGHCGLLWVPAPGQRSNYCSDYCRTESRTRSVTAVKSTSGYWFKASTLVGCEWCGLPCRHRKHERDQSLCRRCRFIKKGYGRHIAVARRWAVEQAGEDINWRDLGERDGWCCHICSGRVLKRAGTAKQPKGATVDHLVPIADGGSHTWDNVALAHRDCNTSRGAGGQAQLRLTG